MTDFKTDIRLLVEASKDENIGQRMRAVVDAVVSVFVYAYVAGLITREAIDLVVRWYDANWVSIEPYSVIQEPLVVNPVPAPVIEIKELTQSAEPLHQIKPFKRAKPNGFG